METTSRTRSSGAFGKVTAVAARVSGLIKDRSQRWRLIGSLLALLLLAGGLIYYEWVYRPAQNAKTPALQTAVARRGNIILSASGSGTLQAAHQVDLGFKSGGTLVTLNVKVGDSVKAGDLLAELDNTAQKLALDQAKQNLASQTSPAAIATAQQSIAQATLDLNSAISRLQFLISPSVYFWENEVAHDTQAVTDAQAAADKAPSDAALQSSLKKAQEILDSAKAHLVGAQASYDKTYVANNFVYHTFDPATHHSQKYVSPPSEPEILAARSAVTIAQGTLIDSQNLYAALTGGNVPADASGTGLNNLVQARSDLQSAEDSLAATQLIAPFNGTVTSLSAQVGDTVGSDAVMTLADMTKLYVQTFVDESDYSLFKVGNEANVVLDSLPDLTLTGKVVQVNPALDTSSGSAVVSGLVELNPTTADLLLGMGGSVEVIAGQAQNAVLVPISALHEYSPGKFAVFVMRNGKLTVQFVEVGLRDLVNAEIKSGLEPGEVVSTGLLSTKQQ